MHYHLSQHNIFLFLLQVALLLGLARALGEIFRRWNQPSITAEILVGIFLGPTIFGRTFPEIQQLFFPVEQTQQNMLETVAWLGILFFLLKAGLETNFATAWRQRHNAAKLSLYDLIIPMVIAFIPCFFLPARYMGSDGNVLAFALFIATIMTISALPVTARVLEDLKVYRTDMGLLIMSALTINDVVGWIVFALILGFFTEAVMTIWNIMFILSATLIFAAFCLAIGPKIFDRITGFVRRCNVPEPAGSLTLVCLTGLICGAVTTWIGIHALFGFFIAGILVGESRSLNEKTRHIFAEMVHAILVPIFFASIGLKLDFFAQFDLFMVLFILIIGLIGRFIAAYIGSRAIRQPKVHSKFIALAHIPGGEMQIVIGMLAFEYHVISEQVYVAIVFGAVVTAMMAGPLMRRVLKRLERNDWLTYLPLDHIFIDIPSKTRQDAIAHLCRQAAILNNTFNAQELSDDVMAGELQMTSALDNNVAVPHARLDFLERPFVLLARSRRGLEWNARDGRPVHFIFLVFTDKRDPESQLQILRGIATTTSSSAVRSTLMESGTIADIMGILREHIIKHSKK